MHRKLPQYWYHKVVSTTHTTTCYAWLSMGFEFPCDHSQVIFPYGVTVILVKACQAAVPYMIGASRSKPHTSGVNWGLFGDICISYICHSVYTCVLI